MTDYAGETISVLIDRAKDGRGLDLDDDNVDSVTVTIYDAAGTQLVSDDATWDSVTSSWYFDWDTTTQDPGRYTAEVRIISMAGPPGIEYLAFTLSPSPVPV